MGYQPVTISESEFNKFYREYYASANRRFLRIGQMFCNRYNITNPELFYETDRRKAENYIYNHYVLGLSNPPNDNVNECPFCHAKTEKEFDLYCTGECSNTAA